MVSHLTLEERDRIASLRHQDANQKEIARAAGRACSTICRELRHNCTARAPALASELPLRFSSRKNRPTDAIEFGDRHNFRQFQSHNGESDLNALAFYEFEYDLASRFTSINDVDGLTTFDYDDRDQLTGADRTISDPRGDESYTYDANGNRTDSHRHGSGYVTGDANRLLSDGTYDYEYDDEGNMIQRSHIVTGDYREFDYDHRNRLTRVIDHASGGTIIQEVTFTYDALGRRISSTVDADGAGSGGEETTHFVYEGDNVLLDFFDADGSQPVSTLITSNTTTLAT